MRIGLFQVRYTKVIEPTREQNIYHNDWALYSPSDELELNFHSEQLLERLVFGSGTVEVLPCIGQAFLAGLQSPQLSWSKDSFKLLL